MGRAPLIAVAVPLHLQRPHNAVQDRYKLRYKSAIICGVDGYRTRVIDRELAGRLTSSGAVVLEGPRACGKTTTARQQAASEVLLDTDANARQLAEIAPRMLLEGDVPRLLDEWQVVPELWNHIRRAVDDRRLPGQFILSGSAVPPDDVTRHTGAGRIARLRMRPMSLFESGHSSGAVSLTHVMNGSTPACPDPGLTVPHLAERVAVGGWPAFQHLPVPDALRAVADYLEEITRTDIGRVDRTRRDPSRVARVLRSLARNVGTSVAATKLASETGSRGGAVDRETVGDYLEALERLMVVENQPAWAPHLRSRSIARVAEKRHFVDPSLAVAALSGSPDRLLNDLRFLGLLYESLVIRDLRIYAQALDGRVLHYRDNTDLEVDAIVELRGGSWAGFEVKLGGSLVDDGAAHLLKFRQRVDTTRCGEPVLLAVITATGYGYVRPDGIAVIPIGALGP